MIDKIKSFDCIGNPIQFKIHSSERYQTVLGGLLTLTIVSLVVSLTISLLVGLSKNRDPIINRSVNYRNNTFLNLTQNFPLMLTVAQRGNIFITNPDSYFTITAYAWNGNYTYNGTERKAVLTLTQLDLHKCSNETIHNDFGKYTDMFLNAFSGTSLDQAYCFPMGQDLTWIEGYPGQRPVQYLVISVNFCDNSTSKVKCKTKDEIIKALSNGVLLISYPDFYFDPNLYDPGVFFISTKALPVSTLFFKRYK